MNTVKDIVRKAILEDDDIEIYNLPNVVKNWPVVAEPDSDDEEPYMEGQDPFTFTLVKFDENTLVANNIHEGYADGISQEDIMKALTN